MSHKLSDLNSAWVTYAAPTSDPGMILIYGDGGRIVMRVDEISRLYEYKERMMEGVAMDDERVNPKEDP